MHSGEVKMVVALHRNTIRRRWAQRVVAHPSKSLKNNPIDPIQNYKHGGTLRMKKLATLAAATAICLYIPFSQAADVEVTWIDPTCGYFVVELPEGTQEEAFGLFSARSLPLPAVGDQVRGDMAEIETTLVNLRTEEIHTVIHWADAKRQEQLVRNTPVQCASKWKNRKKR
jgi:hypothetical protein